MGSNQLVTKLKSSRDQKRVMINHDCYLVKMAIKLSQYDQEITTKCKQKILKTQWVTTVIYSTLTAIILLHYRVAAEMALEILGYTMCRVRSNNLYLLHLISRLTVKLRSRDTDGERFTGGCDGHLVTWTLLVGTKVLAVFKA